MSLATRLADITNRIVGEINTLRGETGAYYSDSPPPTPRDRMLWIDTTDPANPIGNVYVDIGGNLTAIQFSAVGLEGEVTSETLAAELAPQIAKLATIEAGATADMSPTQIKTDLSTVVPFVSNEEAKDGSVTAWRRWSPQRVAHAIKNRSPIGEPIIDVAGSVVTGVTVNTEIYSEVLTDFRTGTVYDIDMPVIVSNTNSATTITLDVKLNGTTIATLAAESFGAADGTFYVGRLRGGLWIEDDSNAQKFVGTLDIGGHGAYGAFLDNLTGKSGTAYQESSVDTSGGATFSIDVLPQKTTDTIDIPCGRITPHRTITEEAEAVFAAILEAAESPIYEMAMVATQIDEKADMIANATITGNATDLVLLHAYGFGMGDDIYVSPGVYDLTKFTERVQAAATSPNVRIAVILGTGAPAAMRVGDKSLMPINPYLDTPERVAKFDDEFEYFPPHIDWWDEYAAMSAFIVDWFDGTTDEVGSTGVFRPGILIDDFIVWNELKGWYDSATNGWWMGTNVYGAGGYCDFYTRIDVACQAVRTVNMGGPYPVVSTHHSSDSQHWSTELVGSSGQRWDQRDLDALKDFITYCRFDWLVIDIKNHNDADDGQCPDTSRTPYNAMGLKLGELVPWANALMIAAGKLVPITIAEWYMRFRYWDKPTQQHIRLFADSIDDPDDQQLSGLVIWGLIDTINAGIGWAAMWQLGMKRDPATNGGAIAAWPINLWEEDYTPTPLGPYLQWFQEHIIGRSDVQRLTFDAGLEGVLNGIAGDGEMCIVSSSPTAVQVIVPKSPTPLEVTIPAYGVEFINI